MAEEHIGQDEIEALLRQAQAASAPAEPKRPAKPAQPSEQALAQDEIEAFLQSAQQGKSAAATAQPGKSAADVDSDRVLGQDAIEQLLAQSQPSAKKPVPASSARPTAPTAALEREGIAAGDIEYLLDQAEQALASVDSPRQDAPPGLAPLQLPELRGGSAGVAPATLELIRDVELDLKIELGRTQMHLEDVLKLRKGAVVPLDKLAGDPVDIYVNGRLIARGEVLVLNDNFCVRVNELLAAQER
jgi:flagellar motor switch protein FliN/FliY